MEKSRGPTVKRALQRRLRSLLHTGDGVIEQLLVVGASVVFRKIRNEYAAVGWRSVQSDYPNVLVGLGNRGSLSQMAFPTSCSGYLRVWVTIGLPRLAGDPLEKALLRLGLLEQVGNADLGGVVFDFRT